MRKTGQQRGLENLRSAGRKAKVYGEKEIGYKSNKTYGKKNRAAKRGTKAI